MNHCWLWSRIKEGNPGEHKPTNGSLPLLNKTFLDVFYSCGRLALSEMYFYYAKFDMKILWPLPHVTWYKIFLAFHFHNKNIDEAFHASSLVSSVSISLLIRLINNVPCFSLVWLIDAVSLPSIVRVSYHWAQHQLTSNCESNKQKNCATLTQKWEAVSYLISMKLINFSYWYM